MSKPYVLPSYFIQLSKGTIVSTKEKEEITQ